ncbi:MAG: VOC family protein [Hydrogenophaga sp.]|uniref:VOC family protein n=1 Tax=Hydrogenophaga sp. TaxID=1904254 RepID=UPI002762C53A|nr:VOC family protein [Hydrogenophaga sp.]MDP2417676.1 VOC family protein [Hydrogenophaga sp.]MDZ4189236.1 VOC family protein [Hydrogenophaga sp.]
MSPPRSAQLDHLVVAARTLDEGVAWCTATLGVVPGPGGEHALFGTHNRLLRLHSEQAPSAYLEIIAINPQATPTRPPGLKRWFDLDDPALQMHLSQHGPQLVHLVASVPHIDTATQALSALGLERGPVLAASRPTPQGLLQWRISVRDDGQRLLGGALPTLIQWGNTHPTDAMPPSGIALRSLTLSHHEPSPLQQALTAIGLDRLTVEPGPTALTLQLDTPKGLITLCSAI